VTNSAPLPATPTLETARLVLRPLRLEDAPAAQRHFAHWEIVRWLTAVVPWPYPSNGAEIHIRKCLEQRARGERFFWAICLKGIATKNATSGLGPPKRTPCRVPALNTTVGRDVFGGTTARP
jgi:RimJ/RimL family protein N-acetyltransferase